MAAVDQPVRRRLVARRRPSVARAVAGVRLRVRPKIAFAIGNQAMAMSHSPRALRTVEAHRTCQTGLCLEVRNDGREPVRIDEIGLCGWFEDPWLSMAEPHLHDNGPWPRWLKPGATTIAYFDSSLRHNPALGGVRRAYVLTAEGELAFGRSRALRAFVRSAARG